MAAEKYKPDNIKVLLVAEAPPAADDRYFYFENVVSNDWLFLGVSEVMLGQRPSRCNKAENLESLCEKGIFLIDLKPDPVDDSPLQLYVSDLIDRCLSLNPERIILIKATVFDIAYTVLKEAGLPVVDKRVYFPSTGQQGNFRKQFKEALAINEIV
jgi:hypothetical protein